MCPSPPSPRRAPHRTTLACDEAASVPADEGRLPDQEDAPGGEEQAVDGKNRLAGRRPSREQRPQKEAAGEPYYHYQQHRQGSHKVETVLDGAAGRSCFANLHADSPAETLVCAQCGGGTAE